MQRAAGKNSVGYSGKNGKWHKKWVMMKAIQVQKSRKRFDKWRRKLLLFFFFKKDFIVLVKLFVKCLIYLNVSMKHQWNVFLFGGTSVSFWHHSFFSIYVLQFCFRPLYVCYSSLSADFFPQQQFIIHPHLSSLRPSHNWSYTVCFFCPSADATDPGISLIISTVKIKLESFPYFC